MKSESLPLSIQLAIAFLAGVGMFIALSAIGVQTVAAIIIISLIGLTIGVIQ